MSGVSGIIPLLPSSDYSATAPGFAEGPEPVIKRNFVEYQPIPWNGKYTPLPAEEFNTDPSRADVLYQMPVAPQNGQNYHPSLVIDSPPDREHFPYVDGMMKDNRPGSLVKQPQVTDISQYIEE
jgi:hypothetical protein